MTGIWQSLALWRRSPPPFYFLHIPKTGGTSLGSYLLSQCPGQLVLNCSLQEMLSLSCSEIQAYSFFAGHYGTLLPDRLAKPLRLFTMLRDPLERTVSSIHYGKVVASTSPELAQTPLVRDALINQSIDEIVNDPFLSLLFVNSQVLHLGCRWSWNRGMLSLKSAVKNAESPEDMMISAASPPYYEIFCAEHLHSGKLDMNSLLVAAKKQLLQMDVVGIMEHFADSAALISGTIGVKKPTKMPVLNVAPGRISNHLQAYRGGAGLSADTIKRIDELNASDHELYDFGLDLFRRQQVMIRRRFFFMSRHG